MKHLAIESSCDETSIAIFDDLEVLSNVIATQISTHREFGGVVPEIASRMHIEAISAVLEEALAEAKTDLSEIEFISVTRGPGLIGALLVGVSFAKALAMSLDVPIVPVNHMKGHIAANYITTEGLKPPFVSLVVSGGHTYLVNMKDYYNYDLVGRTLDDAAGESFDKVARALGLPYPGGPEIEKLAKEGNPDAIELPRVMMKSGDYNFSFSGLKTAVLNYLHNEEQRGREVNKADVAASFQKAAVDVLAKKAVDLKDELGYDKIVLAGGVSNNKALREALAKEEKAHGFKLYYPKPVYTTDNAAMIAAQGYLEYIRGGEFRDLGFEVDPNLGL